MEVYQVGNSYVDDHQLKQIAKGFDNVIKDTIKNEKITFGLIKFITIDYLDKIRSKEIILE